MPLDLELTRLASSPPPPAALRAGAAVSVDISSGRVSLGGVAFATLSAEDVAKVSSSSSSFSNPSQATVRTIRREKDSISSVTIRLVEPSTQQARPQYQQQPRRALGPPPSSTLDPEELACRLTKGQLDALATSPEVLGALESESTRAAVTRALAAADSGSAGSSAAAALESEGAPLAGLATAVLDCLEKHGEEEERKKNEQRK